MTHLVRNGGPVTSVAARCGVGFTSMEAFLVVSNLVEREAGAIDAPTVPGFAGRVIAVGDVLDWVWFPERTLPAGVTEPQVSEHLVHLWDATAFALDIVFTDGSRLSAGAVDQYSVRMTPVAQFEARMLSVDQWNRRSVALMGYQGKTVDRIEVLLGTGSHAVRGWLDAISIEAGKEPATDVLELVSTTRGTHSSGTFSRGNNAPLVALPHGGVFGLPMTNAAEAGWPYSYQEHNRALDNRPTIQAFATSHLPSPWMGDRGVFQIMPSPSVDPDLDRVARALAFDHDEERPRAHRYDVRLDAGEAGSVTATMTAGLFALGWRFRFVDFDGRALGKASIILDHHGLVRDFTVRRVGETTVIEVVLDDRANTPEHFIHLRIDAVVEDKTTVQEGVLRGSLTVRASGPVDVRLGISTVSFEDAAANLDAAGGVDSMLAAAENAWREKLDIVTINGVSNDRLVSFTSNLYRLFLYPNRAGESALTGNPHHRSFYGSVLERPIRDQPGPEIVEAEATTTNGFWDTYRTSWPLLALLTPETAGELAQGFVEHFIDGGWTPRWSAPGAEDVMTGTTTDTIFADLLVKGVPGLDIHEAYRSAIRNATVPSQDPRVGRKGLRPGAFRGFVDTDTSEGMSWTLDGAINDWSIAVMARLLADDVLNGAVALNGPAQVARYQAEYEWFARRSLQYRNVFDQELGFFIGRNPDGTWRSRSGFDPDEWGGDYTETNAWGTMVTAPHDGLGMVELHGGAKQFTEKLRLLFEQPETGAASKSGSYGFAIHEMTEARDTRMGMFALSNQPAHHIPFFPMFTGSHDESHRLLRECIDRLFVGSDIGQGYPGDEDNGEMSAWYVFVSMGLYPLVPATATYVLVPPAVQRTEIRLSAGRRTVIEVTSGFATGRYIRAVRVNGVEWTSISLPHSIVAAGAHIEFELAENPCGWASDSVPASASQLHGFSTPNVDALAIGSSILTDDIGGQSMEFVSGETVTLPMSRSRLSLYTVTTAISALMSWRIELIGASGQIIGEDRRESESFEWADQTRVFSLTGVPSEAEPVVEFRFVALSACSLTQLEAIIVDRPRS